MTPITQLAAYWRDTWNETLQRASNVQPGLNFAAPAFVLHDLAEELRLTHLERAGARESYLELVKEASGRLTVKPHYEADFRAVREALTQWKGWRYALLQVQRAIEALEATYGSYAASKLVTLAAEETVSAESRLQLVDLSNDMIVHLLVAGHSHNFIQRIARDLLDGYRETRGRLITNFPHGIDPAIAGAAYPEQIKSLINSLSCSARLQRIALYFVRMPRRSRFVFQLRGLNVSEPVTVADATLYDPHANPHIVFQDGPLSFDETFGQSPTSQLFFPNIATVVNHDARDHDAAVALAATRAAQHLDLIKPFMDSTSTIRVVTDSFLVADEDWNFLSNSVSYAGSEEFVQMTSAPHFAADATDAPLMRFAVGKGARAMLASNSADGRRLSKALHISRRGEEAKRIDDKLASHWIVIETLMAVDEWKADGLLGEKDSILSLAIRVLPSLLVRRALVYTVGWRLHSLLRWYTRKGLAVSNVVSERCQLVAEEGQTLNLAQIVDALPELIKEVPADKYPRLVEQIQETIDFYGSPLAAYSVIASTIRQCGLTLRKLYRARNRIVHDAATEGPLFSVLAEYASDLSALLVKQAIHSFGLQEPLHVSLTAVEAEIDSIVVQLQAGKAVNLLALPALNDAWEGKE